MDIDVSDKRTLEQLYAKMVRPAIAKAASIVKRQDLAAEIAHDTFIKLWQGGGKFPNEKAVYAWIYKTCHRAAIDHLRSAKHKREELGREDLDQLASVPSAADGAMTQELVQRYITLLPQQEAEAFVYLTLDGMTQVEVAEVMGLSRRTVQRLVERIDERFAEVRREHRR
jgi:RNA polymerase sigma-70 factor (ECF subfamily)